MYSVAGRMDAISAGGMGEIRRAETRAWNASFDGCCHLGIELRCLCLQKRVFLPRHHREATGRR